MKMNKIVQEAEVNDKKMSIILVFQKDLNKDFKVQQEIKAILTNELQQKIKEMNLL